MALSLFRDVLFGRLRQGKFAQLVFDDDLPERDRAQINCIGWIADRLAHGLWQALVATDEPQEDTGI